MNFFCLQRAAVVNSLIKLINIPVCGSLLKFQAQMPLSWPLVPPSNLVRLFKERLLHKRKVTESGLFGSAPSSRSNSVISMFELWHATCKGVQPSWNQKKGQFIFSIQKDEMRLTRFRGLMWQPALSNARAIGTSVAQCSAVQPWRKWIKMCQNDDWESWMIEDTKSSTNITIFDL